MNRTELYPYQRAGVRALRDMGLRGILGDDPGLGKAQPYYAKILTPTGWVYMGNIEVGDLVVGSDGRPTKVVGVYPQGVRKTWRVEFSDGAATECCDEHLWTLITPPHSKLQRPPRVRDLAFIKKSLDAGTDSRHCIPVVGPVEFDGCSELPLHPYLLGQLIADGNIGHAAGLATIDLETIKRIKSVLPPGMDIRHRGGPDWGIVSNNHKNIVIRELKKLGLHDKKSPEKFLPDCYRYASLTDRWELLRGLMDGDGYCSASGTTQYTSTSYVLAAHVRELVWSLGGTCRMTDKLPSFKDKHGQFRKGKRAYTLTLCLPNGECPFYLTRKVIRYKPRVKYHPARRVRKITPVGEAECLCIRVAAPDHLYVTDDFIVTHNTVQSLYCAWKYLPPDPPGPIICVVPSHLKIYWKREAEHHLGLRVEILSGQRVPRGKLPPFDPNQIYVVNYEILVPPHWKKRTPPPADSWTAWLSELNPRLVIVDEGQRAKNAGASCSRAVRRLCRVAPHALILTGTPLANTPMDLWALTNLVRPDLFPSQMEFALEYTHARKMFWGWEFPGAKNLDLLHGILSKECLVRRRKEDVLDQLPPIQHTLVPLEVDLGEYRRAEADYVSWLAAHDGPAAERAAAAESLARATGLKRLAGRLKIPATIDFARQLRAETGGKVLIGALHYSFTDELMAAFGSEALLVDGRLSGPEKQTAFDRFNADPNYTWLVGNAQSVGTGWSCRSTSDAILAEMPWRPDEVTQFAARIHGVGRGLPGVPARVRHLYAAGTVEEDLCEALHRKASWAAAAVDGDPGLVELAVFDEVKARLRRRHAGRTRRNAL